MKNIKKEAKCTICGRVMEEVVGPMLFLKKYIVENVSYRNCRHCGQELVSGGEYERIRKKIAAAQRKAKTARGSAIGIGRYFVL